MWVVLFKAFGTVMPQVPMRPVTIEYILMIDCAKKIGLLRLGRKGNRSGRDLRSSDYPLRNYSVFRWQRQGVGVPSDIESRLG